MPKEGLKPLEVFSMNPGDTETVVISSIRRTNVSIRKQRKRGKDKNGIEYVVVGDEDGPLCQNPRVISLFEKGLPRYSGLSAVVYNCALRELVALKKVKESILFILI